MSVRTYPDVPRVYIDMDGPLADWDAYCAMLAAAGLPSEGNIVKLQPATYASLPVVPGAVEGVDQIIKLGYFPFVLTKPPSENPKSATQKIEWIYRNFPALEDHIIITPDKGCVGREKDILIDDRPDWANANNFPGDIIHFGVDRDSGTPYFPAKTWDDVIETLKVIS